MTLLETSSKTLNGLIEEAQLIHFNERRHKKKKKQPRDEDVVLQKQHFHLKQIRPLTANQQKTFESWEKGYNLLLHGLAGTGKSFISLYLALKEISHYSSQYKQLLIVRSAVPTRDVGFLPGSLKEKSKVYEQPYQTICNELFGRGDAYEILKQKKLVDFTTTSFIRGNTYTDTIVVVDECNNMSFHELDSIITRLGENSRLVLCGDYRQSDLTKSSEKEGLMTFMNVIDRMKGFFHIEFEIDDIVRSGLVKEYIIAKNKLGIT